LIAHEVSRTAVGDLKVIARRIEPATTSRDVVAEYELFEPGD
jgi:hypothetical protein